MNSCTAHGQPASAVICGHMAALQRAPVGFVEVGGDPLHPRAWCFRCEDLYQQRGDDAPSFKAFNDAMQVCVVCYEEARTRHAISPASQGDDAAR